VAIDFSIVRDTSGGKEAAKTPLHAAGLREVLKEVNKYSQSYKDMGDVHLININNCNQCDLLFSFIETNSPVVR